MRLLWWFQHQAYVIMSWCFLPGPLYQSLHVASPLSPPVLHMPPASTLLPPDLPPRCSLLIIWAHAAMRSLSKSTTCPCPHRLMPHASFTPHASRLMPHASRLTPHASRLTPHASRLTPHAPHVYPLSMTSCSPLPASSHDNILPTCNTNATATQ